jgi:hypothetical protein
MILKAQNEEAAKAEAVCISRANPGVRIDVFVDGGCFVAEGNSPTSPHLFWFAQDGRLHDC